MGSVNMEETGMRTRSFRDEDYHSRRVFLRSYPLHWGEEEEEHEEEKKEDDEEQKEETERVKKRGGLKKPLKELILSVLHWGEGRVFVLKRFKHKVAFYVITCIHVGFKPPTALISG